jgi:hypothetical protein
MQHEPAVAGRDREANARSSATADEYRQDQRKSGDVTRFDGARLGRTRARTLDRHADADADAALAGGCSARSSSTDGSDVP